nr:hypothetical protein [Actinomycetota bacterium]
MYPAAAEKSATTTIAGVLAIVVSSFWAVGGVLLVIPGAVISTADEGQDFEGFVDFIGGLALFVGIVVLVAAVLAIVVGANILKRRRWARVLGIVLFSVFAALSLFGLDRGDGSSNQFDDSEQGSVAGVALAVGVDLLVVL